MQVSRPNSSTKHRHFKMALCLAVLFAAVGALFYIWGGPPPDQYLSQRLPPTVGPLIATGVMLGTIWFGGESVS